MSVHPPLQQYHWVHKSPDVQTIASTRRDRTAIRRHVQNQRIAARRHGELQFRSYKEWNNIVPPESSTSSTFTSPQTRSTSTRPSVADSASPDPNSEISRSVAPSHKPSPVKLDLGSFDVTDRLSNRASIESLQGHDTDEEPSFHRRRSSSQHQPRPNRSTSEVERWSELREVHVLMANNFLQGSAIDPFRQATTHLTNESAMFLSYYSSVQTAGGSPYKLQYLPDKVKHITPVLAVRDEYLTNAMQYEHCLYALYSFVAARLLYVSKVQLNGFRDPAYYMARSMALLRARLVECHRTGNPIDNATIGAITQLALADWTSSDLSTARIHLKTLSALIEYIDVKSPTGRYMIETIRTADFQVALEGNTMPMLSAVPSFEPVSRERIIELEKEVAVAMKRESNPKLNIAQHLGHDRPVPEDVLADLTTTLTLHMGWALEDLLKTGLIARDLHPIIRTMWDCITIAKGVWILETATLKDTGYLCRTFRTQGHRLFTYGHSHANEPPTPQFHLSNCLRWALLIILSLCTNRMATRITRNIDHQLFDACQGYEMNMPIQVDLASRTYLWILLTGALVAEEESEIKAWFIDRAVDISIASNLTSFEELHEAMTGFLYSWTFFLPTMRQVLNGISGRQQVFW